VLPWWAVDGVLLHGRIVSVVFDMTGLHYSKGKGLRVSSQTVQAITLQNHWDLLPIPLNIVAPWIPSLSAPPPLPPWPGPTAPSQLFTVFVQLPPHSLFSLPPPSSPFPLAPDLGRRQGGCVLTGHGEADCSAVTDARISAHAIITTALQ